MIFTLGTYSLKIKTFTNKEINLGAEYHDSQFNLYQKVFYILFIPIFPVEKFWVVKNTITGKEQLTTADLRTKLNLVELKRKSPLWTYTGLIILSISFLFLIGFMLSDYVESGIDSFKKSNIESANNSKTIDLIEDPRPNDVYHIIMVELTPTNKNKKGYDRGTTKYLEYSIIKFKEDSIELKLIDNKYSSNKVKLKDSLKLGKENLINALEGFQRLKMYSKIDEYKDTEAVFKLDEIERK